MAPTKQIFLNYRNYICYLFPNTLAFFLNNELIVKICSKHIEKITAFLSRHTNSLYQVIIDITAADYPEKKNRFELIYNLLSIAYNSRIVLSCFLNETTVVPSVTKVFEGAG